MSADMWLYIPSAADPNDDTATVFDGNLTYNLSPMYTDAGWDFHWATGKRASEIIDAARSTLAKLEADPDKYRAMNPRNGWGRYEDCIEFFSALIKSCEGWPYSIVGTWL